MDVNKVYKNVNKVYKTKDVCLIFLFVLIITLLQNIMMRWQLLKNCDVFNPKKVFLTKIKEKRKLVYM